VNPVICPPLRTKLVPPLPTVQAVDNRHLVHRIIGNATGCCIPIQGMDVGRRAEVARRLDYGWCDDWRCFPGNRCDVCGAPSGGHYECIDCIRVANTIDKQHARSQP